MTTLLSYGIMDISKVGGLFMYTVTLDKFKEDYCKHCMYKDDACCENYKIACYNLPQDNINFLASMIYGKPTPQVLKEGDASQCS